MTRLTGRDRDIELVDSFVDQATVRGGALLFTGDAGVGKTELLDVAASHATATGVQVVYASGAQFEANVSFAGLHQLRVLLLAVLDGSGDLRMLRTDGPRSTIRTPG